MFNGFVKRIALLGVFCAGLSQAATLNIGFITFNGTGGSGAFTIFNVYNYTNLIGNDEFPVLTPVSFLSTSLEIDRTGQSGQAVGLDSPIFPGPQAYDSDPMGPNYVVTKAIFRATLDPATPWNLYNGGIFLPSSGQLELVLLPANGTNMVANQESWYINVDGGVASPEPASLLISGLTLVCVVFLRRCKIRFLS